MSINKDSAEYRAGFEAGYVAGQSMPESGCGAMVKIMRRLGIIGATYGEIADQVCKRLDGCEAIIDSLRRISVRSAKSAAKGGGVVEKIDLIAAIRALKFDDPICLKELNDSVDKLHSEFEDRAVRMTVRSEDLELAYNL